MYARFTGHLPPPVVEESLFVKTELQRSISTLESMESHDNISYSCRPPPVTSTDCFLWLYCTVQVPTPNLANL